LVPLPGGEGNCNVKKISKKIIFPLWGKYKGGDVLY